MTADEETLEVARKMEAEYAPKMVERDVLLTIAQHFNANSYGWRGKRQRWSVTMVRNLLDTGDPLVEQFDKVRSPSSGPAYASKTTVPRPAYADSDEFGAPEFISVSLKVFGVLGLIGGVMMAILTSREAPSDGEATTAVIVSLFVGFASFVLWWALAIVIDLLRQISRQSGQ